jgi:hypothetical protein
VGTPFRRVSPVASAAWAVTFGALWLAPLGGAEVISAPSAYLQPGVIVALLYSGLLAVALSQVLVMRAIPVLGPMRFANFQFLMPPLTVVPAPVLGEPIHAGRPSAVRSSSRGSSSPGATRASHSERERAGRRSRRRRGRGGVAEQQAAPRRSAERLPWAQPRRPAAALALAWPRPPSIHPILRA